MLASQAIDSLAHLIRTKFPLPKARGGMTLLGLDLDDDAGDECITSIYQIGQHIVRIRQCPGEGRVKSDGYDDLAPVRCCGGEASP